MKALIVNSLDIKFGSLSDLSKVIPSKLTGKALNYGQGEGQVEIENTVWGLYVNESGLYELQFEEGELSIVQFFEVSQAIEYKLKLEFGSSLELQIEGLLKS